MFQKIKIIKADNKTHLLLVEQNRRDKLAMKKEESKSNIAEMILERDAKFYAAQNR